jgi:hypothetical protein
MLSFFDRWSVDTEMSSSSDRKKFKFYDSKPEILNFLKKKTIVLSGYLKLKKLWYNSILYSGRAGLEGNSSQEVISMPDHMWRERERESVHEFFFTQVIISYTAK